MKDYGTKDCISCSNEFTAGTHTQKFCKKCVPDSTWGWAMTRYRISKPQFNAMLRQQGNCCKVCSKSFTSTKPVIDHCHQTNRVRGILCHTCNIALGYIENADRLKKALAYLEAA